MPALRAQPAEDRRQRPGVEVDLGAEPVGQHPRQVLGQPAAGDVGERRARPPAPSAASAGAHVDAGRREQRRAERAGAERGRARPSRGPPRSTTRRTRLKPLECTPLEARPSRTSPSATPRGSAAPRSIAPTAKPARSKSPAGVHARHLGGLAADERAPASAQPAAMPSITRAAASTVEPAGGEVVEEEQRLGALADQVVDAHRHEVDADGVEPAGVDREPELGADPVGRGDEDRVGVARGLEVEERAEAAEPRHHPGPRGARRGRLDPLDERVAGVDVDAGLGVGQPVPAVRVTAVPPRVCRADALAHVPDQGNRA